MPGPLFTVITLVVGASLLILIGLPIRGANR